jgi:hypothetical protein
MNEMGGPENLRYGGAVAVAHLAYVLAMILGGLLILFLRREKAIYPLIIFGMIIPYGQALTIFGAHFQMLRFLILFGWARIVWSRLQNRDTDNKSKGLHPIDKVFIALIAVSVITTIILTPKWAAAFNAHGEAYNALGIYFLLRYLVRDEEDILRSVKALILVSVVAAAVMILEQTNHINIFGYLGGESLHSAIREGRIRSQAFFGHSIIAGCYGATLLPLCVWEWSKGRTTKLYIFVGVVSSLVMILTSASSTPIMALGGALLAFALWPLRRQMRWVRRGIIAGLVLLHMVMHGPVWSLIEHIDIIGGNSGYHRYQLIDQCIRHFWDWWLYGTLDNGSWGWDMWDTANAFVGTAEGSGLLALILFVALFSRSFRAIGNARAVYEADKGKQFELWTIGCVVFTQLMIFVGVGYFDQTRMVWYLILCMVIAITGEYGLVPARVTVDQPQSTSAQAAMWRPAAVAGSSGLGSLPVRRSEKIR